MLRYCSAIACEKPRQASRPKRRSSSAHIFGSPPPPESLEAMSSSPSRSRTRVRCTVLAAGSQPTMRERMREMVPCLPCQSSSYLQMYEVGARAVSMPIPTPY
eukprot:3417861-Prymnesium_polylepis.1